MLRHHQPDQTLSRPPASRRPPGFLYRFLKVPRQSDSYIPQSSSAMWLLNTDSLTLEFFVPSRVPDYVILSHRWCAQGAEECTFDDMTWATVLSETSPVRKKEGFSKVQGACRLAARDGYAWIWIDSCCIDKSSSAELQESINSMWNYYAQSNICYVYMADVPNSEVGWGESFHRSEWFTRGWTLQELLAPTCVEFYTEDWAPIGTKFERHKEIAEITRIDPDILVRTQDIDLFSAAQRLSWAAHRKVTREEDEAYSLLGLFDVNMPLLYGEGREKAFIRLQEAIYNSTADHTLFLFRYSAHQDDQPLLADSPTRFCERQDCTSCVADVVQCLPSNERYTDFIASTRWYHQAHEQIMTTVTSLRNEISTTLLLLDYHVVADKLKFFDEHDRQSLVRVTHVVVLNHALEKYENGALCLLLRRGPSLEAFRRIKAFPAYLPHLGDFASVMQKTKILICPGPGTLGQNNCANTIFSVADSFLVQTWSAKGGITHSILPVPGQQNTDFEVQTDVRTRNYKNPNLAAAVSCLIVDPSDSSSVFSVRLICTDKTWSIREVSETKEGKRPRKKRVVLPSTGFADR
ncbi:HET-domain-containing protein [Lophium mytilinum]|uniref:HET-domain-containing protein n=1 Tax=Lophium mytilinum TaxID=390894 RepID=A0A6A6QL25_9PEZI|nr:HET-domain-containing protein [Lophium mytilinum]